MILPVAEADDPRIADFRDVRERDLVGRQGSFMAEGEVVLRLLVSRLGGADSHRLRALLLSEAQAMRLADVIAALPPDVPVYVAGQKVMDQVVGFPIHRGILALGAARPLPEPAALLDRLGERALVVAALGLTNHDNMGGIFRNAAAFGADAVLIDAASCDPLYRKAIRVSVGASLVVPFARVADGASAVDLLKARGFEVVALSPAGREPLSRLVRPPRVAALFGTEGPGLPDAVMAMTRTVAIPMAAGFDSLNVATTSGIVLHHLSGV
ncbi:TrmH family RNA methyltransferase [Xanthobacter oligotrophicus]|uniref:TrmH family RNA methyltransferase n=1 Tax=Xanthobacter oligotrophicus TaxID=2607286 RepID=UPI0011F3C529|nr:RNA methyltransferase [Xanthobacter oligotrophicus]MCG5237033.1 RNA methyltransferase [Xanthobacter oligotrophicus]